MVDADREQISGSGSRYGDGAGHWIGAANSLYDILERSIDDVGPCDRAAVSILRLDSDSGSRLNGGDRIGFRIEVKRGVITRQSENPRTSSMKAFMALAKTPMSPVATKRAPRSIQ